MGGASTDKPSPGGTPPNLREVNAGSRLRRADTCGCTTTARGVTNTPLDLLQGIGGAGCRGTVSLPRPPRRRFRAAHPSGWADANECPEGAIAARVLSKALARYRLFATMPTQIRRPAHRNRLSHKGLSVTLTRLLRNVQVICVLGTLAAQAVAAAQATTPRGSSQAQRRLRLPESQSAARSTGERVTHVIRRGETLSSISRRYGTTVAEVQRVERAPWKCHPGWPAAHHLHEGSCRGTGDGGVGRRPRHAPDQTRGNAVVDRQVLRDDRGSRTSVEWAPRQYHSGGPAPHRLYDTSCRGGVDGGGGGVQARRERQPGAQPAGPGCHCL